ncbi:MAG: hypothetical protein JXA18_13675, partial [Chitinispirillaceae bacterium]|nr:hypothetical protein [Chitinispirillaceae bacterium]
MELGAIALIVSALVVLLQIITLVLIAGTRKSIAGLKTAVPAAPQPVALPERDRMGGRNNDFRRHDRRPLRPER